MGCIQSTARSDHRSIATGSSFASRSVHEHELARQFLAIGSADHANTWEKAKALKEDPKPQTMKQIKKERRIFWETISAYGGAQECWLALKAAHLEVEDEVTAREILRASGLKVVSKDARVCFDSKGFQYSIPRYAVCDPLEIVDDDDDDDDVVEGVVEGNVRVAEEDVLA